MAGAGLALLAGCIQQPTTPPEPRNFTLPASAERVWAALVEVIADLDVPIENMDKSSWFFRSKLMSNAGDYLDCGKAMGSPVQNLMWTVEGSVTATLRPLGDTTTLRINLTGRAYNPSNPGMHNTRCVGRGVLEARIADQVRQRLAGGR
jgi:hypothetical protein